MSATLTQSSANPVKIPDNRNTMPEHAEMITKSLEKPA
jgi:hypothetical protein